MANKVGPSRIPHFVSKKNSRFLKDPSASRKYENLVMVESFVRFIVLFRKAFEVANIFI